MLVEDELLPLPKHLVWVSSVVEDVQLHAFRRDGFVVRLAPRVRLVEAQRIGGRADDDFSVPPVLVEHELLGEGLQVAVRYRFPIPSKELQSSPCGPPAIELA